MMLHLCIAIATTCILIMINENYHLEEVNIYISSIVYQDKTGTILLLTYFLKNLKAIPNFPEISAFSLYQRNQNPSPSFFKIV